ncbi:SpoIIE family protein phosphatase [Streptomyces sp. NPDC052701]|uniref:ATP-binding SpoIIE family protein phosphatase n=1 Tax=Streptomyces sp. NPDC052701 TaxID=3155533 RepID=UPI0034300DA5
MTGRDEGLRTGPAGWGQPAELVLDAAWSVLACTRPALELLGGPAAGLLGLNLASLFDDPSVWAGPAEAAERGRPGGRRAVLRRPGGGRVHVDMSVSAFAEGGEARFLVRLLPAPGTEFEDAFGMRVTMSGGGLVVTDPRVQQRLDLLHAAAVRIGGSLDVVRNAKEAVDLLVPVFADLAAVDLTEGTLSGREIGEYTPGTPMRRVAVATATGPWPQEVHGLGETVVLGDVEAEHLRRGSAGVLPDLGHLRAELAGDPGRRRLMLPPGATSLLVFPLQARGAVLGAVALWRCAERVPFDRADASLTELIGSRLALGLDNARRFTGERCTAEALQRSLLPPAAVHLTAAETSGTYAPASTAAGIGGGWYDVIRLSGTRAALVVGKVRGQGVNAAGATGRLRSAVQTLADLDPPPEELLGHLDDLVTRITEDEPPRPASVAGSLKGATCLYAVYDPVTRRCLVASAGHPPPVLVRREHGTPEEITLRPGPPLGTGAEPFEPVELHLQPGDVLALHSGPLTRRGRDTERDLRHVHAAARAAARARRPLTEVADRVLSCLRAEPREEDIAALLARVGQVPPEHTAFWQLPAEPEVVARARALTAAQLAHWGLEELGFTTELLVSELVTNAVRYAGGPIGLRLILDHRLVCEVSDPSQSQPYLRRARLSDEGGRGLFLVAQLARRWGSRYTPGGKTIWTEQLLQT